ncbi:MAG: NMD3-related protein [Candidatus Micrarchaeota archaeon]
MDKLCPKCGSLSSQKKFIGVFCVDCHPSRLNLKYPQISDIPLCKSCGRVKARGWTEKNMKNIESFILSKCKGKFSEVRLLLEPKPQIVFVIEVDNSSIRISKDIEIRYRECLCPECTRTVSGYYEAIIQLRGDRGTIEKFQNRLLKKLERKTSVPKIEEPKEGIDIYVVSKEKTLEVLSDFGKKFKTSNKLFGVKDGQRVYRTTFCVRL